MGSRVEYPPHGSLEVATRLSASRRNCSRARAQQRARNGARGSMPRTARQLEPAAAAAVAGAAFGSPAHGYVSAPDLTGGAGAGSGRGRRRPHSRRRRRRGARSVEPGVRDVVRSRWEAVHPAPSWIASWRSDRGGRPAARARRRGSRQVRPVRGQLLRDTAPAASSCPGSSGDQAATWYRGADGTRVLVGRDDGGGGIR